MSKHTPGPWTVADSWQSWPHEAGEKERAILILAEDTAEASICHVATLDKDLPPEIHERELANARLIAAAPELFEIVDRIADLKQRDDGMLYGDEDYGYILEKARKLVAAIAKAKETRP